LFVDPKGLTHPAKYATTQSQDTQLPATQTMVDLVLHAVNLVFNANAKFNLAFVQTNLNFDVGMSIGSIGYGWASDTLDFV
jgi:hypothetical protein